MTNKNDIAGIMAVISAAFPSFSPSEATIEIYYRTLCDIPEGELKIATLQCIAENGRKFTPTIGEIRGQVATLRSVNQKIPLSYEAWQEVQKQISINGGDFGKPVWSCPLVKKAVDCLGWRNLRMSEEPIPDRARFIQAYEQFQKRAETTEMYLPSALLYIESGVGDQTKMLADKLRK